MEDFRINSWPMLLGLLWPTLGWLLSLAFYGLVAALGFLGHKRTASRGWLLLGFGGATAFLATLPGIVQWMMMFAVRRTDYLRFLSVALGILGLLKIAAGVLSALGLFALYQEHKGRVTKAP